MCWLWQDFSAPAHAELPLIAVIAQGKAVIDLRARYETVTDASKTVDGNAGTMRARLGYDTGYWNSFQLGFDFDQNWAIGGTTANTTRNGKTAAPVIPDPAMTTLNRLHLSYASNFDTKFAMGRQRLLIGNQRFARQCRMAPSTEQTWRLHRGWQHPIGGRPDLDLCLLHPPQPYRRPGDTQGTSTNNTVGLQGRPGRDDFKSDSHFMDAVTIGVDDLRAGGLRLPARPLGPGLCQCGGADRHSPFVHCDLWRRWRLAPWLAEGVTAKWRAKMPIRPITPAISCATASITGWAKRSDFLQRADRAGRI